MIWTDFATIDTTISAYNTAVGIFGKEFERRIKPITFVRIVSHIIPVEMSIEEFLKNVNVKQIVLRRFNISGKAPVKTAEQAYPVFDRPRGEKDLASVNYHLQDNTIASPIIAIKSKDKFILLDGNHRIVSASIKGEKIKIIFIEDI